MSVKVAQVAVLVALVIAVVSAGKNTRLPTTFQLCSLTDAKLNDCMKEAVQVAIPLLVKGVPSLGVYPIDPLDILAADIGAADGPVAISLNFRKLKIRGFNSAKILNTTFDTKTNQIKLLAKLTAPLKLDGGYKISGKVLVLPIQGEGDCNLTLDDVTAHITINLKEVTKHGIKYSEAKTFILSFDTSKLFMKFENLFNGNKELGDNMNRFLNENWPDILRELKPSIDETFGAAFQAIANRIFMQVPTNNIFLP